MTFYRGFEMFLKRGGLRKNERVEEKWLGVMTLKDTMRIDGLFIKKRSE